MNGKNYRFLQSTVCLVVKLETLFLNQTLIAIMPIIPSNTAKNKNHSLNSVRFLPKSCSKKDILMRIIDIIIEANAEKMGCLFIKLFVLKNVLFEEKFFCEWFFL